MLICPLCGTETPAFNPLSLEYRQTVRACRFPLEEFETLSVEQYSCPACGASDRDRLMALYLLQEWVQGGRAADARVLEIAPSRPFGSFLREFVTEYRSADLYSPEAMDRVDITDMQPYAQGRFDLVFCSHVLEHVIDDLAALRELHRVVAPGGAAVLLVPIPLNLERTDELRPGDGEPGAQERIRRFGQDDHVRMYSRADFAQRIEAAGFRLNVWDQSRFEDDEFSRFGLAPGSRLYVAEKPAG